MATFLQISGLLVQLLLAGLALWYTIETRNLRKHSMQQLRVIQRQHTVAVAPFLLVSIFPKTELMARLRHHPSNVLNVPPEKLAEEAKREIARLENHRGNFYLCSVFNPTSKIALQIEVFVYDSTTKNFTTADSGIAVVGEKESELLAVVSDPMAQKEAISQAVRGYPEMEPKAQELLPYQPRSYVLVLFKDIEQGAYAIKRDFSVDGDECNMYVSELISL